LTINQVSQEAAHVLRHAQHERQIFNLLNFPSVRLELVEGPTLSFSAAC